MAVRPILGHEGTPESPVLACPGFERNASIGLPRGAGAAHDPGAPMRAMGGCMSRIGSFALLAFAGLLAQAPPAAATSGYFHLAQDGICNQSQQSVIFGVQIDCDDSCDKCEMTTTTHFDGTGGGELSPGECATATF